MVNGNKNYVAHENVQLDILKFFFKIRCEVFNGKISYYRPDVSLEAVKCPVDGNIIDVLRSRSNCKNQSGCGLKLFNWNHRCWRGVRKLFSRGKKVF